MLRRDALSVLAVLALAVVGVAVSEAEATLDIRLVAMITNEMDGFTALDGVNDVAIAQISGRTYAVATASSGLHIVDITDPAAPAPAAALTNNMRGNDVAIAQISGRTYAVATAKHLDAHIVDMTDPAAPISVAVINHDTLGIPPLSFNIRDMTIAQISGHTYAIVTLYTTNDEDGIYLIDITDPAAPAPAVAIVESDLRWAFDPNDIAIAQISGRTYAVAVDASGLQIINMTDPFSPAPVAAVTDDDLWGYVDIAQISGRTYAVATAMSGLRVADITDPAAPATILPAGGFHLAAAPHDIAIAQISGRTYAAFTNPVGVQVTDITDPAAPVPTAALIDYLHGFNIGDVAIAQISGRTYAVATAPNGLHVFNMTDQIIPSDPAATTPNYLAGFKTMSLPDSVAVTQISGRTYAVVTASNGVQVMDMYAPAPVAAITNDMLGTATPSSSEPRDVSITQISGRTYAVVASNNGVQIINVTDPALSAPVSAITNDLLGFTTMTVPDSVAIAQISGRTYAVIAAWTQGAQIVDMTDPTAPAPVAAIVGHHLPWGFDPHDVAIAQISGRTYAVFTTSAGAQIVEVTDPAPTSTIWTNHGPRHVLGVTGAADPAASTGDGGFIELDVPSGVAIAQISGRTYAVVTAFASDDDDGLYIIDMTEPTAPAQVAAITYDIFEDTFFGPNDVAIAQISGRTYAVVTSWAGGAQILDITDPTSPTLAAEMTFDKVGPTESYGTVVDITEISGRTYAIFAASTGVQTINMTDPTSPAPVAAITGVTNQTTPAPPPHFQSAAPLPTTPRLASPQSTGTITSILSQNGTISVAVDFGTSAILRGFAVTISCDSSGPVDITGIDVDMDGRYGSSLDRIYLTFVYESRGIASGAQIGFDADGVPADVAYPISFDNADLMVSGVVLADAISIGVSYETVDGGACYVKE